MPSDRTPSSMRRCLQVAAILVRVHVRNGRFVPKKPFLTRRLVNLHTAMRRSTVWGAQGLSRGRDQKRDGGVVKGRVKEARLTPASRPLRTQIDQHIVRS